MGRFDYYYYYYLIFSFGLLVRHKQDILRRYLGKCDRHFLLFSDEHDELSDKSLMKIIYAALHYDPSFTICLNLIKMKCSLKEMW